MFDLMRLPRELRDNIYRHALVRDQVKITTTAPFWTTELGDLHSPINTRDPTSSAWSHRSTRTRFPLSNKYADGITVSYCIDPSITELPNLVLLLTCRRVYAEALRVLYEQNTFDFIDTDKADDSVCNCLYFISDRPIHIRRLIRHISLKIGPNIDQPFFRWLPYFHGNYSLLCQKLAQEIPLRSLRLVIDGAWCGEGEMKYWAQQLVQITGLRRLAVEMSINLDTESIVSACFRDIYRRILMHIPAWKVLRAVSSHTHPQSCRFVAGGRLPPAKTTFHTSPVARHEDDPAETAWNTVNEQPPEIARPHQQHFEAEGLLYNPETGPETPPRPKDRSNYGSAARRAGRNVKRVKDLPPVHIPPWFLDRNVTLRADPAPFTANLFPPHGGVDRQNSTDSISELLPGSANNGSSSVDDLNPSQSKDALHEASRSPEDWHVYDKHNLDEIRSVVSAGLQVPSWQRAEVAASLKPHPVLFCPKDGTGLLLEGYIRALAAEFGTDFLVLSPQDIAEIGGDYMDESPDFQANTLSSLGYDAPLVAAARRRQATSDVAEEDENEEPDEDNAESSQMFPRPTGRGRAGGYAVVGGASFSGDLQDVFKFLVPPGGSPPKGKPFVMQNGSQAKDMTPELKLGLLVDTLLNAPGIKRATKTSSTTGADVFGSAKSLGDDATVPAPAANAEESSSPDTTEHGSEGLIVFVQDYPQINTTVNGGRFLDKLHEVVDLRRKDGQSALIVGAASSKDVVPSLTWSAANDLQNQPSEGPTRTIITPIHTRPSRPFTYPELHERKTKDINIRHIRDMLRRTAPNFAQVALIVTAGDLYIDSKTTFLSGLDESVWPIERISRIVTTALGLLEDSAEMHSGHVDRALNLIELSDNAKRDWITAEKEQRKKVNKVLLNVDTGESTKERMRKLRKNCNDHEKKLLNGVVNPDDIRTTFADVQAPPQTIDALKTMTSLSLVRPDAFTYGVLATDKIPGLLLYGPPGTGKTLLARAVAKESGATVLEVSGSDVYDMYVGEGEKNVKAIFSLAKKLTPCIVFIDEADAILGARSGGSNRTSHRELINQFLREWDGMNEMSAFIMVATNRPFDLDEASLRRLPRRLLVDLPQEQDREAILKIHLKEEMLDPEVSFSQLASQTPFYSGSDLKNLAVAAALACVREEFDTAASHNKGATDGEKYEYPKKRTLHLRHFTRAMEEISASVSEDMGSLSAIRKFDEKYGDRRGRRKKGGYGFKTVPDSEKQGSDSARVRNQT